MAKAPNSTERMSFEDECLVRYWPDGSEAWRMPAADLALLGEFTNDLGPADDYFFVFVNREGESFQASFYGNGEWTWMEDLGAHLGEQVEAGLTGSVDFDSRVIWPPELEDKPLIDFNDVTGTSIWQRLRQWIFPRYTMSYTSDVEEFLGLVK